MALGDGFRRLFRRDDPERDVRAELDFHIEMKARDLVDEGMDPDAARARALARFGSVARIAEECLEIRSDLKNRRTRRDLLDGLGQDLRFGVRKLAGSPGFTAVAVVILALGIGANAAIFSVADAVLLRGLPLSHPDRVVQIRDHFPSWDWNAVSVPNFRDYREGAGDVFSRFAGFQGTPLHVETDGRTREASGLYASSDLFEILDVEPAAGRFFHDREDEGALDHVAILRHDFARGRFGDADEAVGKTLSAAYWSSGERAGQPQGFHFETFTVVGVLPPDFQLPPTWRRGGFRTLDPEIIIPMGLWSWGIGDRGMFALTALAEIEAGASLEQARARLSTVASRIEQEYPESNDGYWVTATPLPELIRDTHGTIFLLLGGSVGVLLLLACVNVATLLLSRSTVRRRELAVRGALGAGRRRLVRQLLTENALLALLGAGAGLALAYATTGGLVALMPAGIPRLEQAAVDLRTVAFTLGLTGLTVLLSGTLPALRAGGRDLTEDLKEGGRDGTGGPQRLLNTLQVAEIALSVVLLVGGGLLVHSFVRMSRVDPGIDPRSTLVAELELSNREFSKYRTLDDAERLRGRLVERLEALPGVEWAGAVSRPPLSGSERTLAVTLADGERAGTHTTADWRFVTPEYLQRMGVDLRAGRYFREEDRYRPVVIVNEVLANQLWPDESAVGGEIHFGHQNLSEGPFPRELTDLAMEQRRGTLDPDERQRMDAILEKLGDRIDRRYFPPPRLEVVGVVEEVKNLGPRAEPRPQVYGFAWWGQAFSVVMRTAVEPEGLIGPAQAAIREVDAVEPRIASMRPLEAYVSETVAESRFQATLVGAFAAIALLLAAVGLYGVVSYSVGRRIQEMGVRKALGAGSDDLIGMVLGEALRIALWGLVPGVAAGWLFSRYLESLLFRVAPLDPWTYGAVALLLLGVILISSYLPARRAVRVDPVEALRAR